MEYVYMQKANQPDATGVTVALSVVDANGNYRTIGTTTADANGIFSYAWTPDIEGKYTVYATFAGSNSYYGSSAESSFYAMKHQQQQHLNQQPHPQQLTSTSYPQLQAYS